MPGIAYVPEPISPADKLVTTTLPTLTVTATTADAGDRAALQVFAVIMKSGKITAIRQMTNTTGDTWTYTPVAPTSTNNKIRSSLSATPVVGAARYRVFGVYTGPIPVDASAETIEEILEAVPDLNPHDTEITGTLTAGPVDVSMINNRAGVKYTVTDSQNNARSVVMEHASGNHLKDSLGATVTITNSVVTSAAGDFPMRDGVPGYGRWEWTAVARNVTGGGYWSGADMSLDIRSAEMAPIRTFWYSPLPTLTVTTPTASQSFNSAHPLFQWTVANISTLDRLAYQEIVYRKQSTGEVIYHWATDGSNPNRIVSPQTIISGDEDTRAFRATRRIYDNATTYTATFYVRKASRQSATLTRTFTINYTGEPAPSPLVATLSSDKAYIDMSWPIAANNGLFVAYVVSWRDDGAPLGHSSERIMARITDRTRLTFRAFEWPYNKSFKLAVQTESIFGGETLYSPAAEATFNVAFSGTVISEVLENATYVILPARRPRRKQHPTDRTLRTPWGQVDPVRQMSRAYGNVITGTYIVHEPGNLAAERSVIAKLRKFHENASLETYCYRDAKSDVFYGDIDDLEENESVDFTYVEAGVDFRALSLTELVRSS